MRSKKSHGGAVPQRWTQQHWKPASQSRPPRSPHLNLSQVLTSFSWLLGFGLRCALPVPESALLSFPWRRPEDIIGAYITFVIQGTQYCRVL